MLLLTDIIRRPGKFEGEPAYVETLWESTLNGIYDEILYDDGTPLYVFVLDDDMRAQLDLDDDDYAILLWEADSGFVCHRIVSQAEYEDRPQRA